MTKVFNNDFYSDSPPTTATPLNNPRIGFDNYVKNGAVSATSSLPGFGPDALQNALTYDIWKPAGYPATLSIDLLQNVVCDYIGIGAHTLAGCEIVITASQDNTSFVEVSRASIQNNDAIMILFDEQLARFWNIEVIGWSSSPTLTLDFVAQSYGEADYANPESGAAHVAVVYLGKALAMPRSIYKGHAPGIMQSQNTYQNNDSDGGQWLGRSLIRRSLQESFPFKNIPADFYRANVEPFRKHAETEPFFVAWRPGQYASECVFGRADNAFEPNNSGPINFMSFTLNVTGHRSE